MAAPGVEGRVAGAPGESKEGGSGARGEAGRAVTRDPPGRLGEQEGSHSHELAVAGDAGDGIGVLLDLHAGDSSNPGRPGRPPTLEVVWDSVIRAPSRPSMVRWGPKGVCTVGARGTRVKNWGEWTTV